MSQPRDVRQELTEYLKELHLPGIRRSLDDKVRRASQESLGYEQFLLELVEQECQERRANRITRMLQLSRLPLEKTFDNFQMKRLPTKLARQIRTLSDGSFLDRRENVLAFGKPGTGKTHILAALCQELIRRGRRVMFTTCARLVQDLLRAKKDLELSQAIKKLAYHEALVIDDIGYVSAKPRGDGSALHVARRALRARQRADHVQSPVLQMGKHLQGPDDDRRRHRPAGPSQRHPRLQHRQLPIRGSPETKGGRRTRKIAF
jgi:DNA replication protein DnaC